MCGGVRGRTLAIGAPGEGALAAQRARRPIVNQTTKLAGAPRTSTGAATKAASR
jgi:hypothetical protein